MTADIRTAAEAEAAKRTIEPNVDDPLPIDHHTFGWRRGFAWGAVWAAARVTPTREQIEDALTERADQSDETGTTIKLDDARGAILALLAGLAEGES